MTRQVVFILPDRYFYEDPYAEDNMRAEVASALRNHHIKWEEYKQILEVEGGDVHDMLPRLKMAYWIADDMVWRTQSGGMELELELIEEASTCKINGPYCPGTNMCDQGDHFTFTVRKLI